MGTTTNHGLPWPEPNEIADVPKDMMELAQRIEAILDAWYSPAEQDARFQRVVLIRTSAEGLPATGTEGDIVFLVTQ